MLEFENSVSIGKRNEDVDFYKGLLMWGVIYGHMLAGINRTFDTGSSFLYAFLTIFDMPFFMILSGFFLKKSLSKKTVIELLRSRTTMIFVPIVIWTLIAGQWTIGRYYFLWAVYVSSLICIFTRILSSLFSNRLGKTVEYLVYVLFIAFTYFYYVPWNMFYLFPFFIVGYSLDNVSFKVKNLKVAFFLFVIGLCFWTSEYRPWVMGWNAWNENPFAIVIYVYRFLLALLGVFVMANVFSYLKNVMGGVK